LPGDFCGGEPRSGQRPVGSLREGALAPAAPLLEQCPPA
jgi:hypothetical protein